MTSSAATAEYRPGRQPAAVRHAPAVLRRSWDVQNAQVIPGGDQLRAHHCARPSRSRRRLVNLGARRSPDQTAMLAGDGEARSPALCAYPGVARQLQRAQRPHLICKTTLLGRAEPGGPTRAQLTTAQAAGRPSALVQASLRPLFGSGWPSIAIRRPSRAQGGLLGEEAVGGRARRPRRHPGPDWLPQGQARRGRARVASVSVVSPARRRRQPRPPRAIWSRRGSSRDPEVSGYRRHRVVLADVGDTVRQGQVLARLDPALIEAQIAQQSALVAQAERPGRPSAGPGQPHQRPRRFQATWPRSRSTSAASRPRPPPRRARPSAPRCANRLRCVVARSCRSRPRSAA
ncbi:hypothetical protein ACRAWD_27550 [Caulobacter segnis]